MGLEVLESHAHRTIYDIGPLIMFSEALINRATAAGQVHCPAASRHVEVPPRLKVILVFEGRWGTARLETFWRRKLREFDVARIADVLPVIYEDLVL
jgi:hypothetical protein